MQLLDLNTLRPEILQTLHYPNPNHEWFITPFWDPWVYVQAARAGMISICWQPGAEAWLVAQLQTEYALLEWPDRHIPRRIQRQAQQANSILTKLKLTVTNRLTAVMSGIRQRFGAECWLLDPYVELFQGLADAPIIGFQPLATELRGPDGALWAGELGYLIGETYTCLTGFVAAGAPRGGSWGLVQILALSELLRRHGCAFMNMGHAMMAYKLELGARVLNRLDFLARWLPACNVAGGMTLTVPLDQHWVVADLLVF